MSELDLLWPRLFIAYCPVATECSKRSLARYNSVCLWHKNSNFDAMLLLCQPAFLWCILWDVFELQHIAHYVHWLAAAVRQVFSGRILSWDLEQLPLYWCYYRDRGCIVSSRQVPLSCCHPSWLQLWKWNSTVTTYFLKMHQVLEYFGTWQYHKLETWDRHN